MIAEYADYGRRLSSHVVDCTRAIHDAARARKNILFEGAQGTLLDLDHGTYPYVTPPTLWRVELALARGLARP